MVTSPKIITGRGAVGSPFMNDIRSGREKNPDRTKNKKDILLRVSKSLIEVVPTIKKIIPTTINPTTKAKVSNMTIASADGLAAKASLINIILNSVEKIERNKGSA
tara:strand:+ start:1451 stop:1768 length:318 start_codon:yes stop_codon:yes gene_type:complete